MDSKDNPINNTTELMAKSESRQTNINDLPSNVLEKIFTRKTTVWCGRICEKRKECTKQIISKRDTLIPEIYIQLFKEILEKWKYNY